MHQDITTCQNSKYINSIPVCTVVSFFGYKASSLILKFSFHLRHELLADPICRIEDQERFSATPGTIRSNLTSNSFQIFCWAWYPSRLLTKSESAPLNLKSENRNLEIKWHVRNLLVDLAVIKIFPVALKAQSCRVDQRTRALLCRASH
jgi:hypothetical protein